MCKLLNKWHFYGLNENEYRKANEKVFPKNIQSLCRMNILVIILLAVFLIFSLFTNGNSTKTIFIIGTSITAALIYIIVRCKYCSESQINGTGKNFIYILIFFTYVNIISFGIYLSVWTNPEGITGSFFVILICALLLFNIPSFYYFCLTVCSAFIFIYFIIMVKNPVEYFMDIIYAVFTGIISLIIGWQINMNRLSLAAIVNKMEEERDNYHDQSTIDDLTHLKNRRDFMDTFQRFLTNHRHSDNFLCIAILDIDFFKKYNDYYGHPKGDECLQKIGNALIHLQNEMNIYIARIGGEEFAMLWFEKEAADVQYVASRVIKIMHNLNIPHEKSNVAPHVTLSMGIYVVQCSTSDSINTLYNSADKALYDAKKKGRNCVCYVFG